MSPFYWGLAVGAVLGASLGIIVLVCLAAGMLWYDLKSRVKRRKPEGIPVPDMSAYTQITATADLEGDAFAEAEEMVIEEMLRGQRPKLIDITETKQRPPGKMGGYQPNRDPLPLPPIATEDVETEIDIDTPSFLGKPEPVKLKITKRKKRRR